MEGVDDPAVVSKLKVANDKHAICQPKSLIAFSCSGKGWRYFVFLVSGILLIAKKRVQKYGVGIQKQKKTIADPHF